jgi:hypothetical protein
MISDQTKESVVKSQSQLPLWGPQNGLTSVQEYCPLGCRCCVRKGSTRREPMLGGMMVYSDSDKPNLGNLKDVL